MLQHLDSTTKPLIGKGISNITREGKGDNSVILHFSDGYKVRMDVEGDCCSTSIFYEIVLPEECKNQPLTDIITYWYDREDDGKDTEKTALAKIKAAGIEFYPEENSVWDVVFVTEKGEIRVRHINSSNGYYDGMVTFHSLAECESKGVECSGDLKSTDSQQP